jgi:thiaminase (transcriptional activator TenA)
MSLAKTLWEENRDLAQAALEHPFVQGLRRGTLPYQNFQGYIAQDVYFIEATARAYALALARAPDQRGLYDFFDLLAGVINELREQEERAAEWVVETTHVFPDRATQAYIDFLFANAAMGGIGETCAAFLPCIRLYAFLGQTIAADCRDNQHRYVSWIRTYAHPDIEMLAVKLEDLLDRYVTDSKTVRSTYRRAMELELDFFTAHAIGIE